MRKLFSLFVALLATTCLWAYDFQSGDLYYKITSSSEPFTVEVTNNGTYTLTSAVIPSSVEYNGITYAVTSIGQDAFYACTSLTSISIPNSVTTIGYFAFTGCSSLTSISIPKSVIEIGKTQYGGTYCGPVFTYCPALTSIVVEEGNPIYDSRDNCNAIVETATNTIICGCKNTTFPQSVTGIGYYAFNGCSSLSSITIPNHITDIQSNPFLSCSSLATIVVESNNSIYDSRDNCNAIIQTATNTLIAGCQNTIIPNSVTGIGVGAFYGCSSITSINIPENVTSIGVGAFRGCSSLISVYIPENVTSIGGSAFYGCSSLISINIPEVVTSIEPSTFTGCSALTSINIPESVTGIGDYAFDGCSSLTSVTIPNSVTYIGIGAFQNCDSLTSVTIPENITNIGDGAFSGCFSLNAIYCYIVTPIQIIPRTFSSSYNKAILYVPCESLDAYLADKVWEIFDNIQCIGDEIPKVGNSIYYTSSDGNIVNPYKSDGFDAKIISNTYENGRGTITFGGLVGSIRDSAFYSCHRLTSITIPKYVDEIGAYAFYECSLLYSITCLETTPPSALDSSRPKRYSFQNYDATVYVPCEALEAYKEHRVWSKFADIQCIEEEEKTKSYIYYTSSDGNIVEPNAYLSATDVFGANIISNTYENGRGIITFAGPVTNIGESAFSTCSTLTNITIPNTVKHIGSHAFETCFSLNSIIIPNGVESIDFQAFGWCSSLESITIPSSVTYIGENLFAGCDSLVSVMVDNQNPMYDSRDNCNAIIETATNTLMAGCKNTIIPNTVKNIGNGAFRSCYTLSAITIPNSVSSIGEAAFDACFNLTSITIPNSVNSIGYQAFAYTTDLAEIIVESDNLIYDSREGCNAIIETATNTLIAGCKNTSIPNTIEHIGGAAFYGCQVMTSIDIPEGVKTIGEGAFFFCHQLSSISIPNSVTLIDGYAFYHCSSLTSITIPENVTNIGARAFQDCEAITSITWNAKNCVDFEPYEGTVPFYLIRSQITSFTFGDKVEHIPAYLCYKMDNLSSITIPTSVTSIGEGALAYCLYDTIYCLSATPPIVNKAFSSNDYNAALYTPCESLEAYKAHEVWGRFNTIQCLEDSIPDTPKRVLSCAEAVIVCLETGATATTEEYTIHGYVTEITNEYSEQYKNISFYMADTKDGGQVLFTYRIKPMYEADIAVQVGDFVEVVGTLVNYNGYLPEVYPGVYTIVNEPELPTGTSDIQLPTSNTKKVVKDGQLLILRDGKTYTIMGAEIK